MNNLFPPTGVRHDPNLWQHPWFIGLTPRMKCLWIWLWEHCDPSGFIEPDWPRIIREIGAQYSEADTARIPGECISRLGPNIFQLMAYVPFQQGN